MLWLVELPSQMTAAINVDQEKHGVVLLRCWTISLLLCLWSLSSILLRSACFSSSERFDARPFRHAWNWSLIIIVYDPAKQPPYNRWSPMEERQLYWDWEMVISNRPDLCTYSVPSSRFRAWGDQSVFDIFHAWDPPAVSDWVPKLWERGQLWPEIRANGYRRLYVVFHQYCNVEETLFTCFGLM